MSKRIILLIILLLLLILGILGWYLFTQRGKEEPTPPEPQHYSVNQTIRQEDRTPESLEPTAEPTGNHTAPFPPQGNQTKESENATVVPSEHPTIVLPEDNATIEFKLDEAPIEESVSLADGTRSGPVDAFKSIEPPKALRDTAGAGEDPMVSMDFVDDLARHIVASFYPQGSHPQAEARPITLLSVKTLNMRYGVKMTGLRHTADDVRQARRQVLGYLLGPAMRSVYGLYADKLVELVKGYAGYLTREFQAADGGKRRLTPEEQTQLLRVSADWGRGLSACLRSLAKVEDLEDLVRRKLQTEQTALDANEEVGNVLMLLQPLRDKAEGAKLSADERNSLAEAEAAMRAASNAYQQALKDREAARTVLVEKMYQAGEPGLGEASCAYVAAWLYRRDMTPAVRAETSNLASELLLDMADLLDKDTAN